MWSTLFRGFAGWVAKNWAGVAAGYAIGDVAANLTPDKARYGVTMPDEPKSKIVRGMQSAFGKTIPVWVYGIISAVLLFWIYRTIDKRTK